MIRRREQDTIPTGCTLSRLSVVIPARDEEASIGSTIEHLHLELGLHNVPHEIVVVEEGSTDGTWRRLVELREKIPEVNPVKNDGEGGFGNAIIKGIDTASGDAVVIVMADGSDDPQDVVHYWNTLNEGWDCVFGSRFVKGGGTIDYPLFKWILNRLVNTALRAIFWTRLNDTTGAFKAYRVTALDGCRPFLARHFNVTVELPLKAIVRGYSWTTMPITWRNRRDGVTKLKLREMGGRYFFIIAYVWLEKFFSRGDYRKSEEPALGVIESNAA